MKTLANEEKCDQKQEMRNIEMRIQIISSRTVMSVGYNNTLPYYLNNYIFMCFTIYLNIIKRDDSPLQQIFHIFVYCS